jgi:hypothetical protein
VLTDGPKIDGDIGSATRSVVVELCSFPCWLALDFLDIHYCKACFPIIECRGFPLTNYLKPRQTNFIQFILYFFLSPETSFSDVDPPRQDSTLSLRARYIGFRWLSHKPLKPDDFLMPLSVSRHHVIWVITIAYSVIFNFAFVLLTVEIPQIYEINFPLNTQQIGLQFLGMMIGGILGEQGAGRLSDLMMTSFSKKHQEQLAQPEFCLWLSYLGYATLIAGFLIWGFRTADILHKEYDVSPIVGIGISSIGAQVITTSVFTYMVDCYPTESAETGIFANVVRQIWGFIGPSGFLTFLTRLEFRDLQTS